MHDRANPNRRPKNQSSNAVGRFDERTAVRNAPLNQIRRSARTSKRLSSSLSDTRMGVEQLIAIVSRRSPIRCRQPLPMPLAIRRPVAARPRSRTRKRIAESKIGQTVDSLPHAIVRTNHRDVWTSPKNSALQIGTLLTHPRKGYKVPTGSPPTTRDGVRVSADWWAYKFEVFRRDSLNNGGLMHDAGVWFFSTTATIPNSVDHP